MAGASVWTIRAVLPAVGGEADVSGLLVDCALRQQYTGAVQEQVCGIPGAMPAAGAGICGARGGKVFCEDIQRRAEALEDRTFVSYDEGYQLFTDHNYVMRIRYPRNHFVSVVESGDASTVKTIYGYGSHYYIDKIKDVRIEHVKDLPMWC